MTSPKLDAEFVKTFALATMETLKVQCNFPSKAGRPFAKTGSEDDQIAIAGVIGIVSEPFRGSITIGFPEQTFLNVMAGMLGEAFTEIDKDLQDGAGELVNIIFGVAKRTLADKGFPIDRAIPSVMVGKGIKLSHMSKSAVVVIPFEGEGGPFQIEIVIE